jgi:hypothetical protein
MVKEGPSRLLYTVTDNENWTRHKQNLRGMEGLMNLSQEEHMYKHMPKGKPD